MNEESQIDFYLRQIRDEIIISNMNKHHGCLRFIVNMVGRSKKKYKKVFTN